MPCAYKRKQAFCVIYGERVTPDTCGICQYNHEPSGNGEHHIKNHPRAKPRRGHAPSSSERAWWASLGLEPRTHE